MNVRLEELIELVKSLRPLFLDRTGAGEVREKGLADFVTAVDFRVQETLRQILEEKYPEAQLLGEEKDNQEIDFERPVWILDPVDGTTNLIHDFQHSTLSLALFDQGELRLGIVYQPYTGEVFSAEKGKGAFLNGRRLKVSEERAMERSLISVGTSPYRHELAEENFRIFQELFLACSDIRRLGSAALELAFVAAGRTEAFFERGLHCWDYAAGLLLVQEAGGRVTDWLGEPVDIRTTRDILASNGLIGEKVLEFF